MTNPINEAQTLKGALVRVLDEVQMVPKWKDSIHDMVNQTDAMIETLTTIHTEVVPLDLKESERAHVKSLEFYKSLPGGNIQKGTPDYERLLKQSATLRELYRAGFEIPSLMKFTEAQVTFTKELGDRFQNWHDPWHLFKLSELHGENYRVVKARFAKEWIEFLQFLKKWGVVSDFRAFYKDWKKKAFVAAKMFWIRKLHPTEPVRFEWAKATPDFDPLISGHWFSAFAYSIIIDHLDRLGSDYEIFTLVRYHAPADVIRSSGDFDVIVRAGQKIVMIECKSGILRRVEDRDDFAEIVEKAEALKRVFVHAQSEITDYSFWLLYNPFLNDHDEVARELNNSTIFVIKPENIRGEVRRCFEGPPPKG